MAKSTDKTREYARAGASARLVEIEQERAAILKLFPELRASGARLKASAVPVTRRTRRKPTDAERRKMSAGMRKYWAKRKAQAAQARG